MEYQNLGTSDSKNVKPCSQCEITYLPIAKWEKKIIIEKVATTIITLLQTTQINTNKI